MALLGPVVNSNTSVLELSPVDDGDMNLVCEIIGVGRISGYRDDPSKEMPGSIFLGPDLSTRPREEVGIFLLTPPDIFP